MADLGTAPGKCADTSGRIFFISCADFRACQSNMADSNFLRPWFCGFERTVGQRVVQIRLPKLRLAGGFQVDFTNQRLQNQRV